MGYTSEVLIEVRGDTLRLNAYRAMWMEEASKLVWGEGMSGSGTPVFDFDAPPDNTAPSRFGAGSVTEEDDGTATWQLSFGEVKWYPSYASVQAYTRIYAEAPDDLEWDFIRLGEDLQDAEHLTSHGDSPYYISRSIERY